MSSYPLVSSDSVLALAVWLGTFRLRWRALRGWLLGSGHETAMSEVSIVNFIQFDTQVDAFIRDNSIPFEFLYSTMLAKAVLQPPTS